jgi:hypothetical protein
MVDAYMNLPPKLIRGGLPASLISPSISLRTCSDVVSLGTSAGGSRISSFFTAQPEERARIAGMRTVNFNNLFLILWILNFYGLGFEIGFLK